MKNFDHLIHAEPEYIESLYEKYLDNDLNVEEELRLFFAGFDFAVGKVKTPISANGQQTIANNLSSNGKLDKDFLKKELAVYHFINSYRDRAHLISDTNPIRQRIDRKAQLTLNDFGLEEKDLDRTFIAGHIVGMEGKTLKQITKFLKKTYASKIGFELDKIISQKQKEWLINKIETEFYKPLPLEKRKRVLEKLNQAVILEKFMHTKFVGQKRFSLEGGESFIVGLDAIINKSSELEVEEAVIGMAHRGRLNVLSNIMGKTYDQLFSEFEGNMEIDTTMGSGDVKYHLGFSSHIDTMVNRQMYIHLSPNPSHLESVVPVALGYARSKAYILHDEVYPKVLPILVHGDSSLPGQGVVYETIQMSKLRGYYTGGSIHFVINNQIGFTTDFVDARSSNYCTSIASIIESPVFHVNGDDPEAVLKCCELAAEYRQKFNQDVFIDIVCYRRHGHNEGDDPKFTQPDLYNIIEKHPNPRDIYIEYLEKEGNNDLKNLANEMQQTFWKDLQDRLDGVKETPLSYKNQEPEKQWDEFIKPHTEDIIHSPNTSVTEDNLKKYFESITHFPSDFTPNKKIGRLINSKIKLFEEKKLIDWGTAELLAYASLIDEGYDVRLSGEDVKRGTFSHRHSVLHDINTNLQYSRLDKIAEGKDNKFTVFNSLLSEYGVLGFEYGFSLAHPKCLVIWEAQFGDFYNGAQIVVDQYISSSEQKWRQYSGLVMLLPHGYEGQGPEHSNARLERFLSQCAEDNMIITNVTTASNFFHLLKRQMHRKFRKPLINFSPKSNLRLPESYSLMEDFTNHSFQSVLDCNYNSNAEEIKKVLLCTGKIYFELAKKQKEEDRKDVAVIRLEQIYPTPTKILENLKEKYSNASWYWIQEEPHNMGASYFIQINLRKLNMGIISRKESAATATGHMKTHLMEQTEIIDAAFKI